MARRIASEKVAGETPRSISWQHRSDAKGAWTVTLRCLYVSSEVTGFAKTGGLADVAASLPRALAQRGVEVAVIMPLYRSVRYGPHTLTPTRHELRIPIGTRTVGGRLWQTTLPGCAVPVYLVEQADYFERDDSPLGRGIYQMTDAAGQKVDYPDNCERFVFFSRAVLEAIRALDECPDVLHLNDWQSGLVAVYLRELHRNQARGRYAAIRTLLTIHNLAYQGLFWHFDMPLLGLPWRLFTPEKLEFYGKVNFLKAGLVYADQLNTVSPTYAREIQTPYYGSGLQGVLLQRSNRLTGIVNGIDYDIWNPASDPHLAARYDVTTVATNKPICKKALQEHFGLETRADAPLLGMVSRLATQKGLDLVEKVLALFLKQGAQFVVLGDGEKPFHDMLIEAKQRYPQQIGLHFGFSEAIAHRIEAGADLFLMPSQYEPCGLNQLYSLKYGTVPVVRATGGLADTVTDTTPDNLAAGKATGFTFAPYTAQAFTEALNRALHVYRNDPHAWTQIQQTGMLQDWSWNRSAAEYEKLYRALVAEM
jgi:starch synthase